MNSFYWSLDKCDRAGTAFNIVCGGRGTGKTYGVLRRCYQEAEESERQKFIYVRRTEVEVQRVANEKFSPFKSLNRDYGWTVCMDYNQGEGSGNIYSGDPKAEGTKHIGYTASLATFDNFRGADIYDVSTYVLDEFLKPPNKSRRLKRKQMYFSIPWKLYRVTGSCKD